MKDYLRTQIRRVLDALGDVPDDFEIELEAPDRPEHGDLATNTALRLASVLGDNPRSIADTLAERLRGRVDPARIKNVEVAGPGFVNFRFAQDYLFDGLADLLAQGDTFGQTDAGAGQRALVEYVSANPTGPLNVGHGRNAVLGDTIANLLAWTGYDVTREYYYNDAGRQMRVLAQSVRARYEALAGNVPTTTLTLDDDTTVEVPETFPEDGYLGQYIVEIAQNLYDEHGDALCATDDLAPFRAAAETAIFGDIEATLHALNIDMDGYANEQALHDEGRVDAVLDGLADAGYTYEEDGALWFKTTEFGTEDDTVLVKQTGEPTYRTPDIAYHAAKFERGFDLMVDVFGADHHAAYPDVLSALDVLGYDTDRVDVILYQFVTLVRGDEPVKMSTRRANYVTLDDLIEQVGADVTRFFFLMRSPDTHLNFDLELAEEESEKNPVFYLQYAHARICSVLDKAEEVGFSHDEDADLALLTHEDEIALIKELLRFPQELQNAAGARAPHFVPNYLRDVATAFSQFYDNCRIIGEEQELASARMRLALAAKTVLKNGLTVLGISAPRQM
ncbi:arginine--tRNA ligase [Salinibacter ruber]|uniref:Arginine--tRNA ligase n=5 Tax=Salinibacter ruber TaxID=146919 RepID=A0A9X2Q5D0_9BACT|nr:arginine--tRNA ligase [Salinibacter ruber]MCS3660624.1 arginyl-tRNA synthetase [Salinibacter ruber]MCS3710424.1 arginyl-tRNA synthetase [Salinibacter ruber]MCS4115698.1 arginyl-tRNA synthetase [Salinibacter ruber]MCS4180785.1 arginyl-tRNA synthetase [Salinibacter ruber]CBH24101.1 Arginyl-tRNA synthetase, class Ic [Salinibacter ruber M8]